MRESCIEKIKARQLLDCKGRPTVEVDVFTKGGILGRACAPTGSSVGMYEAHVLRDNNPSNYMGMSVYRALENIHDIISPALIGMDVIGQKEIDKRLIELDGTAFKSKLGGNAIYAVSLACIKAAASMNSQPLYQYMAMSSLETIPIPTFNTINGGLYKEVSLPFQEYTFIPYKAASLPEAVELGCTLFKVTGDIIQERQGGKPAGIGNYWGWQPPCNNPWEVMMILEEAAERCGAQKNIGYALDCACSEMYNKERDTYVFMDKEIDGDEMLGILKDLTTRHNILYLEDPLDQNDWKGWQKAVRVLDKTLVVGDDLTVTNVEKLKKARELEAIGGFVFKPNQVGTITEALAAYEYARANDMLVIPSIRAGGIVDDAVMDMAVALNTPFTKQGSPRTGERTSALNFLLRVAEENPEAKLFVYGNQG